MTNKPTPAEAMALWYSLDRPSGYEVAARFTAAGRPIAARTVTRWKNQGWQDGCVAIRNSKQAAWSRATGARTGRTSNKPTPAEAMALYYSLDRPSSHEVAARFTAAGRPIVARTIRRWRTQGWPGVANAPRTDRPTPAEAQAIWDSLEQPTLDKVVNAFKAQGRPIGRVAIWNWKQAGWSRVTAKNAVAKATRAIEKIAAAVPALTGDPMTTLSDIVTNDVVPGERRDDEHDNKRRNDTRSNVKRVEHLLRRTMRTVAAVGVAIQDIAAAVSKADDPVLKDAPLPILLTRPEGIATLMKASTVGIGVAIEGLRRLPAMRAEEAAEARRAESP